MKNKPIEIQYIEKETKLEYQEVIFDSEYYDWKWKTSLFDQLILNREKLMFLIEINDKIIYNKNVYNRRIMYENSY